MAAKSPNSGNRHVAPYSDGKGRPVGSKSRYGNSSVRRMEELGLDPLEELVEAYRASKVYWESEDLTKADRQFHLRECRQILLTLLPYRWMAARDPEKETGTAIEPLRIFSVVVDK